MSCRSAVDTLLRRKYLEDIYDRMTDEEKILFIQMTMQNKSHSEIMQAINKNSLKLEEISKGQDWTRSFGSDLLANFTSASLLWLGSKIFGKT